MSKCTSKFWKMVSNPINNWLKLYFGLLLPILIYSRNIFLIAMVIIILLIITFLPRKMTEMMKIDFMYQAVRGYYLLLKKEIAYYSDFGKKYLSKTSILVCLYAICCLGFIFSIILLWQQYLILGSFLFYFFVEIKLLYLNECANASKHFSTPTSWEELEL